MLEVDQHSGLALPLVDEVAGLPGMQLGLLAGGRRLLLLKTDDDSGILLQQQLPLHALELPSSPAEEVEICLVGYSKVYTLLPSDAWRLKPDLNVLPPSTVTRWSWDPTADGVIRTNNLTASFTGTVECKPVDVLPTHLNGHSSPPVAGAGMQLLVVSDTGGVAIVDRPSQRVVFCAKVPGAHSAALLPDGRVAVVGSNGNRLAVFDIAAGLDPRLKLVNTCQHDPVAEAKVDGAHGVVWLNATKELVVVGSSGSDSSIYIFSVLTSSSFDVTDLDESGAGQGQHQHQHQNVTLNLTMQLRVAAAQGLHDLSPFPASALPAGHIVPASSGPLFTLTALNGRLS